MFEERNDLILNSNIILYDKQRNMNGLEPEFFNSLLKNRKERRGGGKKKESWRKLSWSHSQKH